MERRRRRSRRRACDGSGKSSTLMQHFLLPSCRRLTGSISAWKTAPGGGFPPLKVGFGGINISFVDPALSGARRGPASPVRRWLLRRERGPLVTSPSAALLLLGGVYGTGCLVQTPFATATARRVLIGEQSQLQASWFWRARCACSLPRVRSFLRYRLPGNFERH